MKKALFKLLALSLALTFVMGVLSGCGDTAEKDSDGDVVKIGFVTYLAGDQAYVGQAAKLALEDYVTELNENGGLLGKQVKLITYDYSKDPATEAVNATNKLIQQDGVIAILGPSGSQSAIPMIPVVTAAKIPVIAGEQGICAGCGIATLSISYYDIGYTAGQMAYDVLVNGADITTMEIKTAPQVTKEYNADICSQLGITPPDDYVAIETE